MIYEDNVVSKESEKRTKLAYHLLAVFVYGILAVFASGKCCGCWEWMIAFLRWLLSRVCKPCVTCLCLLNRRRINHPLKWRAFNPRLKSRSEQSVIICSYLPFSCIFTYYLSLLSQLMLFKQSQTLSLWRPISAAQLVKTMKRLSTHLTATEWYFLLFLQRMFPYFWPAITKFFCLIRPVRINLSSLIFQTPLCVWHIPCILSTSFKNQMCFQLFHRMKSIHFYLQVIYVLFTFVCLFF